MWENTESHSDRLSSALLEVMMGSCDVICPFTKALELGGAVLMRAVKR